MDIEEKYKKVEKYILGETGEEFICINEEDNQKIAVSMIQQAEFHLDILSYYFDPDVYDTHECCEAIEDLALRSRHSRIRILLHDSKTVSQRGHLVLYLGKRLGSLMQFRNVAEVHKSIPDTFMIVDGIGVMHRPHTDTLAATVNFKDRPKSKELSQLFEKIWADAEPDPNARDIVI
ncbi:hypothetical protein [Candidatus Parabeggiatoa sp. HSG14]|uniref:DUF7931 domain-containing protein n=1 Tax=Candidatus Parabeggiatoa sp. HSG14 TaxID=3055593 RepID=UPI0025A8CE3A|nr:hypothetical protein [Thiotrichales bacterium HSG14]